MSKQGTLVEGGIDVGAKTLVLAVSRDGERLDDQTFDNTSEGRTKLVRFLQKRGKTIRIVLEATGIYGLDTCLALHRAGIEVMLLNPRASAHYAKARMERSKTDTVDAAVLLDYVQRMPFVRWVPPAAERLELRAMLRRIDALRRMMVEEKNRLAAAEANEELTELIGNDIEVSIRHFERRIEQMERQAMALVTEHDDLLRCYELLKTISGIGHATALLLAAELLTLPSDMSARELVAHAGLDPRRYESGTSVHKAPRISKAGNRRIRAALFLPAFVAIRYDEYVRAFYERLLRNGKKPLVATVAVMRKLLHAIHGVLRSQTPFDSTRFTRLAA